MFLDNNPIVLETRDFEFQPNTLYTLKFNHVVYKKKPWY